MEVDRNYKTNHFRTDIVTKLLNIIKALTIYKIHTDPENKPVDYYLFFSFKIKNGEIETILP
jgi:hypothetical protein